jgi:hypothetical protein
MSVILQLCLNWDLQNIANNQSESNFLQYLDMYPALEVMLTFVLLQIEVFNQNNQNNNNNNNENFYLNLITRLQST